MRILSFMPVFRIQVNFHSREVFELPRGMFDAGGVQVEVVSPNLTDAIGNALDPAKAKLSEEFATEVIEKFVFSVVEVGENEEKIDEPFYYRPEGENSFSVRADKLELMKSDCVQSPLLETTLVEDTLTLRPLVNPGYSIDILNGGRDYEVWLCGWHLHMETIDEVQSLCWWLFTSLYRIGRETCDGKDVLFWLEIFGEEGWKRYSQVYSVSPYEKNLWESGRGKWERTYYQQSIYPADERALVGLVLDSDGNPVGSSLGEVSEVIERSAIWEEDWGYWEN
jgi:hypothetical protein